MNSSPGQPLRFIPFRCEELLALCLRESLLDDDEQALFEAGAQAIDSALRTDFAHIKEQLKTAYGPHDPDRDTRQLWPTAAGAINDSLPATLSQTLERANYRRVSQQELEASFSCTSAFDLDLSVPLDDFEEVLLYVRGAEKKTLELSHFFGLQKERIEFLNFDRAMLYLRFKPDLPDAIDDQHSRGGSTLLKLFQDVPAADIEMLFPNTRISMRTRDKLMIALPAALSGSIIVSTKLGASLLLVGSILGYWLGLHGERVVLDRQSALILLTGLAALLGYFWKQVSSYRNKRLRYNQALTQNLYFKLLDNNAGVFYRVLDEAQESEQKECLLAYHFLLAADAALSPAELAARVEGWFEQRLQTRLTFEARPALERLAALGLARRQGEHWSPAAAPD